MATQHESRNGKSAPVEARIAHIAQMMRALRWKRGESVKRLAKAWGVAEQRVRELSADASKQVRGELADPAAVTTTVTAALEWALHEAKRQRKPQAIARVAKVWSDIIGASAPRRLALSNDEAGAVKLPDDPTERGKVLRALAEHEEAKAARAGAG